MKINVFVFLDLARFLCPGRPECSCGQTKPECVCECIEERRLPEFKWLHPVKEEGRSLRWRCINVPEPKVSLLKAWFDIENIYICSLPLSLSFSLIFNIKNAFECSGLGRGRMEKMETT